MNQQTSDTVNKPSASAGQPTQLLGMTLDMLRKVAEEEKLPRFAATQIADWLYKKQVTDINAMTNLSKEARHRLARHYTVGRQAPLASFRSVDGTCKYLFTGAGGHDVEAVMIPDRDRATLCVSSQAGCRMNCRFCMTGRQGFHGNLTAAAIVNQILSVPEAADLTNVVFMGMGEPMDNIYAVIQAIEVMTAPWGLAWSPKRITVSSIGNLDGLRRLLEETSVHVALSLHNPYSSERLDIMPVEKAYPLLDVLRFFRNYDFSHQRRLSIEYILWRGVNDNMRYASALARILKPIDGVRVNLIRFHAIPDCDLHPCSQATMEAFRDRLNELGITATIRASRGEDIMAACGMLAGKHNQEKK